jgi:hypothetical protein
MAVSRRPSRRPRSATRTRAHGLEDGGARQDQIGPLRPDAGFRRATLWPQGLEAVGRAGAFVPGHPQAVDEIAVVTDQSQMNARQAGDGARGADQMGLAGVEQRPERSRPLMGGQPGVHVLHHRLVPRLGRRIGFGMALGEGDHPQRRRHPADRLEPGLVGFTDTPKPGHLGGAAAHIHHHHGPGLGVEQVQTPLHGQARLLLGRDDAQLQAGAVPHPFEEMGAVVR